jgi:hypothetical protein
MFSLDFDLWRLRGCSYLNSKIGKTRIWSQWLIRFSPCSYLSHLNDFIYFSLKSPFVYPEIMKTTQLDCLIESIHLRLWISTSISHAPSIGCSDFKCSPLKAVIPTYQKKRKQHWMFLQPFNNVFFVLQLFYNVSVLYMFMSICLILLLSYLRTSVFS